MILVPMSFSCYSACCLLLHPVRLYDSYSHVILMLFRCIRNWLAIRRLKELEIIYRLKCNTLARAAAEHVSRQRALYAVRQAASSSADTEEEDGEGKENSIGQAALDTDMKVGSLLDEKRGANEEVERERKERQSLTEDQWSEKQADTSNPYYTPSTTGILRESLRLTGPISGIISAQDASSSDKNEISEKVPRNLGSGSAIAQGQRVPTYRNVTSDIQYNGKQGVSVFPTKNPRVGHISDIIVNGKRDSTENPRTKKSPNYMSPLNTTNKTKTQKSQIATAKPKKKKENQSEYIYQSNISAFEQQQGCFWDEKKEKDKEEFPLREKSADLFKYVREVKSVSNGSGSKISYSPLKAQPTNGTPSQASPHGSDYPPALGPLDSSFSPLCGSTRGLSDIPQAGHTPSKETPPIPTYSSWIDTQPGHKDIGPGGGRNINDGERAASGSVNGDFGDRPSKDVGAGVKAPSGAVVFRYGAPKVVASRTAQTVRAAVGSQSALNGADRHVGSSDGADSPAPQSLSLHDTSRLSSAVPRVARAPGPFKPAPGRVRVRVPVPISAASDSRGKPHPPWSGETDF